VTQKPQLVRLSSTGGPGVAAAAAAAAPRRRLGTSDSNSDQVYSVHFFLALSASTRSGGSIMKAWPESEPPRPWMTRIRPVGLSLRVGAEARLARPGRRLEAAAAARRAGEIMIL
jgi:hypothetical protein